jgi:hypothetical protein
MLFRKQRVIIAENKRINYYICTIMVRLNFKDMLIISSREFRQNQRLYFERADKGEQIIVQRGKDKSYALTPINEDDIYFSAEMVKKIKRSAEQAKKGEVKSITNSEEINDLLGL